MKELPRYQSHKIVRALQIASAIEGNDIVTLHFVDGSYPDVVLPAAMFSRYFPKALDYYVVYDNLESATGAPEYISISPRDVFEAGYSLIQ